MPIEKRDSYSQALIFVPTREERVVKQLKEDLEKDRKTIKKELDELKDIKKQYMDELNEMRKG